MTKPMPSYQGFYVFVFIWEKERGRNLLLSLCINCIKPSCKSLIIIQLTQLNKIWCHFFFFYAQLKTRFRIEAFLLLTDQPSTSNSITIVLLHYSTHNALMYDHSYETWWLLCCITWRVSLQIPEAWSTAGSFKLAVLSAVNRCVLVYVLNRRKKNESCGILMLYLCIAPFLPPSL